MSPIHVADSVRIALGTDSDCQALADALDQTVIPTKMCYAVQEMAGFQSAVVVLDAQRASASSGDRWSPAAPTATPLIKSRRVSFGFTGRFIA